jgi:hypothetical protein
MSWPNERYISCTGFDRKYLPVIQRALDGKMVVWGRSHGFAEAVSVEFTFAGCHWQLDEVSEYVTGIRVLAGSFTEEDLTAALLGAKIETS